jgi:hypothetical protein
MLVLSTVYYLPELERISNEIDTKFPVTRSEVRSAIRLSCLYKEFECEEEAVASGIKITDEVIEIAKSYEYTYFAQSSFLYEAAA